jgi:hypothetical protein
MRYQLYKLYAAIMALLVISFSSYSMEVGRQGIKLRKRTPEYETIFNQLNGIADDKFKEVFPILFPVFIKNDFYKQDRELSIQDLETNIYSQYFYEKGPQINLVSGLLIDHLSGWITTDIQDFSTLVEEAFLDKEYPCGDNNIIIIPDIHAHHGIATDKINALANLIRSGFKQVFLEISWSNDIDPLTFLMVEAFAYKKAASVFTQYNAEVWGFYIRKLIPYLAWADRRLNQAKIFSDDKPISLKKAQGFNKCRWQTWNLAPDISLKNISLKSAISNITQKKESAVFVCGVFHVPEGEYLAYKNQTANKQKYDSIEEYFLSESAFSFNDAGLSTKNIYEELKSRSYLIVWLPGLEEKAAEIVQNHYKCRLNTGFLQALKHH